MKWICQFQKYGLVCGLEFDDYKSLVNHSWKAHQQNPVFKVKGGVRE
jgi:hypothetical protein